MILISVPGEPVAKGRPRLAVRNGHAAAYTPAKTVAYEGLVALAGQDVMAGRELLEGPLFVEVIATFGIRKSWSKRDKERAASGIMPHVGRPDLDNIVKAAGDGLNGVVWRDDSQIVRLACSKRYGPVPGLSIMVKPL